VEITFRTQAPIDVVRQKVTVISLVDALTPPATTAAAAAP